MILMYCNVLLEIDCFFDLVVINDNIIFDCDVVIGLDF